MGIRFDAVVIILSSVFILAFALAGSGQLDFGPYSKAVLVVLYFTLFAAYDQFKRPYKQRNYIMLFGLLAAYLGAAIAFLLGFGWSGVWYGAGIALASVVLLLVIFRNKFYAKLDQLVADK